VQKDWVVIEEYEKVQSKKKKKQWKVAIVNKNGKGR